MNQEATIHFMPMTAEHVEEVCNVVGHSFSHEPMTETLHLTYEQVRAEFAKVVEEVGPMGYSSIAVDQATGKIVGACINKDFMMEPMGEDDDHSDALAVFNLVDELDDKAPELRTLPAGDTFHIYLLAVDSSYKKRDIGLNLVKAADKTAREHNFKKMLAEVTGPVSQHIFLDQCDYGEVARVNYKDFVYEGEKVFKDIDSCEACILVRKDVPLN